MGFLSSASKKMNVSKPALFSNTSPPSEKKKASPQGDDPDDKPTVFSTFMILYIGVFGVTLAAYPDVWAQDGPFTNPMAYWTTIGPDLQFGFHMLGAAFLVLVLGPFIDDIFGGVGVKFMAFVQQMLLLNLAVFFVFLYYGYYAPLATAVGWVWKAQACFQGFVVGWNLVEAVGTSCKDYYTLFTACYFGFFAVGTMSRPALLFGPPSPLAYWTTWTELGLMTCRSFGIAMFILFVIGYAFYGKTGGYCKMCTLMNLIFLALFVYPAYFSGWSLTSAAVEGMWEIQLAVQIPIVVCGLFLELTASTGALGPAKEVKDACGLNAQTYNFVNLCFQVPFVLAFYTKPDLVFGPANPMGVGFLTVEFDEPALWHGRAWAAVLLTVVASPYLFGFAAIKVTKQMTVAYGGFCALFAYAIFYAKYAIFDLMVFYPLAGLNFVFFVWGLVIWTVARPAGEPML